jgi:hypothetical protein
MNSNCIIHKRFTQPILDWVLNEENRDKYITDKPEHSGNVWARDYLHTESDDLIEAKFPYICLNDLSREILEYYRLDWDTPIEPNYGILLCYSTKGHKVHEHRDANFNVEGPDESLNEDLPHDYLGDVVHVRFNLLISKPDHGGNPVISGTEYNVKENELWSCVAGMDKHSTTRVVGDKPRVLLSFGHFIPLKTVKNQFIYKTVKKWKHGKK